MNEDARRDALVRSRMIAAIRAYLDGEGFVEVETPILQPQYGGAFAEPFVTHSNYLDQDVYLRIADELYLKRLIVGGLEKVYEISKDFRNESVSYKHSPEFTQLEWYEAYADYNDTMERTETLVERAAQEAIGTTKVTFSGHEIDLARPWQRVKFVEALEEKGAWSRDPDELRAKLDAAGVDTSHDKTWAQLVDHAYSHFVEPELIQPTFVIDWPIEMSPFARTTDDDPALVERFEAVVGGMEFANAFSELNDSAGAGRALRDAGRREGGGRRHRGGRRSGLCRGPVLRDAADGRLRHRHGPSGDGADRPRHDPRRHPLSGASRTGVNALNRDAARRWWPLALGVLLGVVAGVLVSLLGSSTRRAEASVLISSSAGPAAVTPMLPEPSRARHEWGGGGKRAEHAPPDESTRNCASRLHATVRPQSQVIAISAN